MAQQTESFVDEGAHQQNPLDSHSQFNSMEVSIRFFICIRCYLVCKASKVTLLVRQPLEHIFI